jgi:hypothetical protein
MRAYEFRADEVILPKVLKLFVDLDAAVNFSINPDGPYRWNVMFSNSFGLVLTESGFDRVLSAWKSG